MSSTPDRLRILQVSTADVRGGAERVASSLFAAYRARGHGSWLAVGERHTDDVDVLLIPNRAERGPWRRFWLDHSARLRANRSSASVRAVGRVAGAIGNPARTFDYHLGRENFHFPGTWRVLSLPGEQPDVVHAHNLHGDYFDLRALPFLSQRVPLILTLHDAWLLSGHCAHSFDCERWRTGCGNCPDLEIYPAVPRDATAHNFRRKRTLYARSRFCVATPSRWLMHKVEQSMLVAGLRETRVIPNGIDLSVFRPGDRRAARQALGLPIDAPVLLTTGLHLRANRWKDLPTLREAVIRLDRQWEGPRPHVVALGTGHVDGAMGRAELHSVPYLADPATVAAYYQAADVYVHAARADTFPLAVLEALACGTPVVASAVGGIPEQVDDGRSGFLVPVGDASAMAERLGSVLRDQPLRDALGAEGIRQARRRFDFELQVDAYLDWYRDLVAPTARSAVLVT
jgi:glycosyltransferase involved in cell wall biosynthesis